MRLNSCFFFIAAAVVLLAESQPGTSDQRIEVRTSNGAVEIMASAGGHVEVNESPEVTVTRGSGGVVVVSANGPVKLQAPRGASLEVTTSNGAIHVSGMTGVLRLSTSNGVIVVSDSGGAEIHARTSNGLIRLGVPRGLNADLTARTSNGEIHSDLNLTPSRVGTTFLEGKIGNGGAQIDLLTSNGAIYIGNETQQEKVNSVFTPGEVK